MSLARKVNNRRGMFLGLTSSVASQLREAFADRRQNHKETQEDIAALLGVNRSVVNRRLRAGSNLTLETIADMAWALGRGVKIDIYDPAEMIGCNERLYFSERATVPLPSEEMSAARVQYQSQESTRAPTRNKTQIEFKSMQMVDA